MPTGDVPNIVTVKKKYVERICLQQYEVGRRRCLAFSCGTFTRSQIIARVVHEVFHARGKILIS